MGKSQYRPDPLGVSLPGVIRSPGKLHAWREAARGNLRLARALRVTGSSHNRLRYGDWARALEAEARVILERCSLYTGPAEKAPRAFLPGRGAPLVPVALEREDEKS